MNLKKKKNNSMVGVHYNRICEIIRDDRTTFLQLDTIDVIIENFGNLWGKEEGSLYKFLQEKKSILDKKFNKNNK